MATSTPSSSLLCQQPEKITESEWAISRILSCTDPRTICRLALVNKTFLAASESDFVWARFLPLAFSRVAERADGDRLQNASKRELYFRLCRSISVDNGAKRYWLDRPTGAECYMLSAKALSIIWGNDPRYWKWLPREGSWFQEVAYLGTVWWLEISGTFREILRPGTYTVSFRMQFTGEAYGWDRAPVKLSVSTSNGHQVESTRLFHQGFPLSDPPMFSEQQDAPVPASEYWVECDAGEFTVEDDDSAVEVQFCMREVEVLWSKGGLFLDGVMVRPSHVVRQAPERGECCNLPNPEEEEEEEEEEEKKEGLSDQEEGSEEEEEEEEDSY